MITCGLVIECGLSGCVMSFASVTDREDLPYLYEII